MAADYERSRLGMNLNKGKEMRIRLRIKDSGLTRDRVIDTVFVTTEVPFIRIFGDAPVYVALCKERDAFKLLKTEMMEKLRKKGIEVQIPIEIKAKRSVLLRRLDRHMGAITGEEVEAELEKNHDWIREVKVIKIKEYTLVLKLEFQTVEEAERVLERGLLLFNMQVSSEQISRDEFVNVLTCFKCYRYEDPPTKSCTETRIICSECSEEGAPPTLMPS